MGKVITFIMRVFSVVLLVMVGVNLPKARADLLARLTPDALNGTILAGGHHGLYLILRHFPAHR